MANLEELNPLSQKKKKEKKSEISKDSSIMKTKWFNEKYISV